MQFKDFFVSFILVKSLGFNKAVARRVKYTHFSPGAEKSDKSDSHIKKKKKSTHAMNPFASKKVPWATCSEHCFSSGKEVANKFASFPVQVYVSYSQRAQRNQTK